MDKIAASKKIEKLRCKLGDAIDNCTDLTDADVVEISILLDDALNLYNEIVRREGSA